MALSTQRYQQQLQALLPPGAALLASPGSELEQLLGYLAERLAAVDRRAAWLLAEADPRRALALLPEWEASLDLPDRCTAGDAAIAARRAAVVSKLTDPGGARLPRYLQLLASLGYGRARISRHRYHHCEMDCEAPLNDIGWRHSWTLHLPLAVQVVEASCESGVEEPLRHWGDTLIDCVLHREAPAVSTVLIAYEGGVA